MKSKRMDRVIVIGGLCVLAFGLAGALLSRHFVYGEGHSDRPIIPFLLFYTLGWCGFALATLQVWRRCTDTRVAWLWILGVGVAARLLMSASGLIQENDCYRYVLDGEAILHGVNPFRFSPAQVAEAGEASFGGSADAQRILARVGYPDIPTIYPPLAQLAFTVGAWLTPWSWHGQRIVFLLADLGTIAVLVMLLSRLGRPRHWIVFYAWNPLIIKEIANSAHVESLLSLSLSLLVLSCCYWQARPTVARLVWVALAFSAAILSKLYPIMLAPILAVYVWRTARTVRPVLALGAMCLMTGALAYAPFMSVGWARLTEGLRTFSGTWVRNAGIYELLELATPYARFLTATAVVLAALVSAYSVLRAGQPLEGMIRAMVWTLLVWFLTLPMVFPWYAIGLLTLCTVQPRLWSVVLSGMLGLYYMLFYNEYNGVSGATTVVVKAVEHAVVIAVLLLESVLLRRGRSLLELANPAADSC
ncbi:MAG: hypothetical protein ACI9OU_000338 [Candidatus Promineifilaceae bacterium]|jgi:hypothetical protein